MVPEPDGPGTTVEVIACGLCGSDVEKFAPAHAGAVLGHEVVA
ncbi:MAG: alcohol dehydrogenase, partial [Actinobacteria bacterium]|nr:alcohol dehydrogenase [Actinomycetota bacterium]